MPDEHAMRYWIGQAAKRRRMAAERKLVHVGASANRDQSTIYRFEEGDAWPRDADSIISAYADDLDIEAIDLWEDAIALWREALEGAPSAEQLAAAEEAAQLADAAGQPQRDSGTRTGRASRSKGARGTRS